MENNTTSKVAEDVLRDLASDRRPLTARLAAPWWVHPLVALLVAGYVATPAISPGAVHNVVVGILAGAFVMLVAGYRWCTGVRLNRVGVRGGAVLAGLVVTVLLLLSASNGLTASPSAWWVIAPAVLCFVAVLAGSRWFERLSREDLRRGR
jgi:hypothetical protein